MMPWQDLEAAFVVPAKPRGLWTLVRDYLPGPLLLKFEVKSGSEWSYSAGTKCTPDGDYGAALASSAAILSAAPYGALIAKFGGSSAGTKDGDVVLIGEHCIYAFLHVGAPLYLTINDDPKTMSDNAGEVALKISCCSPAFLFSATPPITITPGSVMPPSVGAPVATMSVLGATVSPTGLTTLGGGGSTSG